MMSSDALLREARHIAAAAASDDRLEDEWQAMYAGSRDELLARLRDGNSTIAVDRDLDELAAWLHEAAEESTQQWMNARRIKP